MAEAATSQALIALGGNVGDVPATFDKAIALLCEGPSLTLRKRSANYRTPPWGLEDQPAFVNAAIEVVTALSPEQLLARMMDVEKRLGRDRAAERHWGPRTIDLDLLAYNDVTRETPELTLPHPRLFERAFVLVPLADIAPDRLIGGTRVRDALARIDTGGIERLP
jgi:2-amino-4-hydroxy-6-hydroxymethyldihydropteridine diphosphokinase